MTDLRALVVLGGVLAFSVYVTAEEPVHDGRTAAAWAADLASDVVHTRQKAAFALWKLGPASAPAALPLAKVLDDTDTYVRDTAYRALLGLPAADAQPGVKQLLRLAASTRPEVARLAVWALLRIDPAAILRHGQAEVRRAALQVVMDAGDFLTEQVFDGLLVSSREETDVENRARAVTAIGNAYCFSGRGYPFLTPARNRVVTALTKIAAEDDAAMPREWSLYALGWIARHEDGAAAAATLPPIIGGLTDVEPTVKIAALRALSTFGKKAPEARDAVRRLVSDPSEQVRRMAVGTLVVVAEPDDAVIEMLIGALSSSDKRTPGVAAAGLGGIGARAAAAVPALRSLLAQRDDPYTTNATYAALGRIGEAALPARAELVRRYGATKEPPVELAFALVCLGAKNAPEALQRLVAIAVSDVGGRAQTYLGELGKVAGSAVPSLIEVLDSGSPAERISAAWTLVAMGPVALPARPSLERARKSQEPRLVEAATAALEAIADTKSDAGGR